MTYISHIFKYFVGINLYHLPILFKLMRLPLVFLDKQIFFFFWWYGSRNSYFCQCQVYKVFKSEDFEASSQSNDKNVDEIKWGSSFETSKSVSQTNLVYGCYLCNSKRCVLITVCCNFFFPKGIMYWSKQISCKTTCTPCC